MTQIPLAQTADHAVVNFELNQLNRHGIIAGATGTGKTVTMKVMTEKLAKAGVPVFLADIKGDLASLSQAGDANEVHVAKRVADFGLTYQPTAFPVRLWDVFGAAGTPIRATVEMMGPLLLARILDLNDTQEGVLNVAFKVAQDHAWPLIDLKDLQALLVEVGNHAKDYTTQYGNVSKASVGAIQRNLLVLEQQGAAQFFGEPAIDVTNFFATDAQGLGVVNILMAKQLFNAPRLYATFLIWLLNRLMTTLPEVGDLDKPKLVFFFDEAHLLFKDANQTFIDQVENTVRLIRSKGVGVFFVTQNPADLPATIIAQLNNRVQHKLNAFSANDLKGVKAAANTFRINPDLDVEAAIGELGTGEALVSFLGENGEPAMVQRAFVYPPESSMTALADVAIPALIAQNPFETTYRTAVDRASAYETLSAKTADEAAQVQAAQQAKLDAAAAKEAARAQAAAERQKAKEERERRNALPNKLARQVGNQVRTRVVGSIISAVLKGIFGRK